MSFIDWDKVPAYEVLPGIRLRTPHGEKIMLSNLEMEPGAVVPMHSHPHEQACWLLEGTLEMTIDGEVRVCEPGSSFIIPGGVPHKAVAITKVRALDIFSPPREDYAELANRYIPAK